MNKIRRLSRKDLQDIKELDVRFKSPWSSQLYTERISTYPDLSYGAYEGSRLIGFIVAKITPENSVYISRIVVDKDHEGKGIAKKLMKTVEKNTQHQKFESEVRASNVRSIGLHKSLNYKNDDTFFYKYRDGERGLKFFKNLYVR